MAVNKKIRLTASALFLAALAAVSTISPSDCSAKAAKKAVAQKLVCSPRGEILSLSCSSCHGTDGKSAGIIPSIDGKSVEYIETALKSFKAGTRPSTVMARHTKGYTDEELRLIAEYFGTLSHNK